MKISSTAGTLLPVLLVSVGCYLGATIGTMVRFPQSGTAMLFLPYAILTAALLLSPTIRRKSAIAFSALASHGGEPLD